MKLIAYIFAAVVFISTLITPFTELLGAFSDMCKIHAAITASSRAAIMNSEDESKAKDVEAAIDFDKFETIFKSNFCSALNLSDSYDSLDDKFNSFTVNIRRVDDNKCEIEVKTQYKYKTGLFKRFASNLPSDSGVLRVLKTEVLRIEN
ncbi:MAG: hypothetical protein ACOYWZ_17315 [Bacillota bacterium]